MPANEGKPAGLWVYSDRDPKLFFPALWRVFAGSEGHHLIYGDSLCFGESLLLISIIAFRTSLSPDKAAVNPGFGPNL